MPLPKERLYVPRTRGRVIDAAGLARISHTIRGTPLSDRSRSKSASECPRHNRSQDWSGGTIGLSSAKFLRLQNLSWEDQDAEPKRDRCTHSSGDAVAAHCRGPGVR